jgi:predicted nucleic acid-binding protein
MIYGEIVFAKDSAKLVCDNPDDDKFIVCAIAGNCAIIVSGDKHLLRVSGHKGITVLKPMEFVDSHLKKC